MKSVKTYRINVYLGLKEKYKGRIHDTKEIERLLQNYCDTVGFAVTVTQTKFIYKNGNELGVIVGIINYPRFPKTKKKLKNIAIEITQQLKERFNQHRISIVCDNETIMLGGR